MLDFSTAEIASNFHDWCSNAVSFSGDYPELTVGAWAASAVMMLVQGGLLVKKMIPSKKKESFDSKKTFTAQGYYIDKVHVPYVPGETVLKLLKLLKTQENGWVAQPAAVLGYYSLSYGYINFLKTANGVDVTYKGTKANIVSEFPNFDNQLLKTYFAIRYAKERNKIEEQKRINEATVTKKDNEELNKILEIV